MARIEPVLPGPLGGDLSANLAQCLQERWTDAVVSPIPSSWVGKAQKSSGLELLRFVPRRLANEFGVEGIFAGSEVRPEPGGEEHGKVRLERGEHGSQLAVCGNKILLGWHHPGSVQHGIRVIPERHVIEHPASFVGIARGAVEE